MSLRSGYVGIASLDDYSPNAAAAAARRTRTSFGRKPALGDTTLSASRSNATLRSSRVRSRIAMEGSDSSPKLPSIAGAARERERVRQPRWSSSSAAAQWPPPPEKQQRHEQRAAPTTVMDLGWRYSTRIYRVGNTADQYQDRSVWHHRKPLAAAAGGPQRLARGE